MSLSSRAANSRETRFRKAFNRCAQEQEGQHV